MGEKGNAVGRVGEEVEQERVREAGKAEQWEEARRWGGSGTRKGDKQGKRTGGISPPLPLLFLGPLPQCMRDLPFFFLVQSFRNAEYLTFPSDSRPDGIGNQLSTLKFCSIVSVFGHD